MSRPPPPQHDQETALDHKSATRTGEPPLYRVLLLNDDFTPMEFVVDLVMRFFNKSEEEATRIMLSIHHQGQGVCGLYPREIAETKVTEVNRFARSHGHPLKCSMERN